MAEVGLGLRFKVTIDGYGTLGTWTKCEGLTVEYDIEEYREGGQNGFVHRIPGRAKYQNIRLTRPVGTSSSEVTDWLRSVQGKLSRRTGEIAIMDASGATVAAWSLAGIYPARWAGPSLDVSSSQVATETLELVHDGFLGPG